LSFERPIKGDLDRGLSLLMHDASHKAMDERNRIKSDATKAGALHGNRLIVAVAEAVDRLHQDAMKQATAMLFDFIGRMQLPPAEVIGWARPHLENLSNSLLGIIPPNSFPADHQRIVHQYRLVFYQRLDGVLRDVEIGFVKGEGFARAEKMEDKEEWISSAQAIELLKPLGWNGSRFAIASRANDGLVRAKARRFMFNEISRDNFEVPKGFWSARGQPALTQNWLTGDFETWIDHKDQCKAYGVLFLRSDIEAMVPEGVSSLTRAPQPKSFPRRVFVVHGHDEAARETVARFLEKIGFKTIILHEQANQGKTVIEKIEANSDVGFAVVLLTPDDVGSVKGGNLQPRARQNVILELGYFIGCLGRARVCALKRGDVEIPSDFGGVVYQDFDAGGGWKHALAQELQEAGFEIDWNTAMRP
jgi:predicted nucleotide-binding protein